MSKVDFMKWLYALFKNNERFEATYSSFSPGSPSNNVLIKSKQGWFTISYCEGWPQPILSCVHFPTTIENILLLEAVFEMWKKVRD